MSTIPSIGITRTGEILDVNIADILITGNGELQVALQFWFQAF